MTQHPAVLSQEHPYSIDEGLTYGGSTSSIAKHERIIFLRDFSISDIQLKKRVTYTFRYVLSGLCSFRYRDVYIAAASGSDSIITPRSFGNDSALNPALMIARYVAFFALYDQT